MPVKKKNDKPAPTYLCYVCGKTISGDHVYVKTRRRTELRIHFECMKGGRCGG